MKKSKWLITALVILIVLAAGIFAYLKFGVSADVIINKSNDLQCISKEVPNKVLFNLGTTDSVYVGTKSVRLNSSEKASPEGIFLRKDNAIYFTNGLRYTALPSVSASNFVSFKIGDIYYIASKDTATDVSAVTMASSQILVAYKEYAYIVDLNAPSSEVSGYLYQKGGITRMCGSANSYEIDIARKNYTILSDSTAGSWNALTKDVTEKFLTDFFASGPPNGDEAAAKRALAALSEAAQKVVLSSSNISSGIAKFVGINGDAPDGAIDIADGTKGTDGSVKIIVTMNYSSSNTQATKIFYLILEGNNWKINAVK